MFGRSHEALSELFNEILLMIHSRFKHLLVWDYCRLNSDKLKELAAAIHQKGAPVDVCVGFIDGTVRGISCPGRQVQKACYNGHKVSTLHK